MDSSKSLDYNKKVKLFENYFSNITEDSESFIDEKNDPKTINFIQLKKFNSYLANKLIQEFSETKSAVKEAATNSGKFKKENLQISITNLPEKQHIPIKKLRSSHLNKLIYLEGTVTRVSEHQMETVSAEFQCNICRHTMNREQDNDPHNPVNPHNCDKCDSKDFRLNDREINDIQFITIKNNPDKNSHKIKCKLKDKQTKPRNELLNKKIRVSGVLKKGKDQRFFKASEAQVIK